MKFIRQILTVTLLTALFTFKPTLQSSQSQWNYKFSFTKNINSQMSIECDNNDQIWIGWSHYGTRNPAPITGTNLDQPQILNFPNENDCWMNFTEKIAEQCNGAAQCDLSSQPTYIHKCGKISDYLYVAYKCIKEIDTFDICKSSKRVYKSFDLQNENRNFYIKSSEFPVEYSSSLDCSCLITSNQQQNLKLEFLWFSLQDNDYLNIFNKNLSGWINPTYEMPISTRSNQIRFMTDDSLAYKGFWLKVSNRKACKDDWQLVGDNCVKVFNEAIDWRSANQKCTQMNGNLLKIDDVVSDLKLTQYMKSFYPEISSYWIGLRKYVDQYNQEKWMWSGNSTLYNDISWWPWRKTIQQQQIQTDSYSITNLNNCVIKRKNEDGYFTTSCDAANKNSFICQTSTINSINREQNSDITLQCGATDEIKQEIIKIEKESQNLKKEKVEKSVILTDDTPIPIGINSINNIILPSFNNNNNKQPEIPKPVNQLNLQSPEKTQDEYSKTTSTKTIINKANSGSQQSSSSSSILVRQTQTDSRLNTAILAGIISGIGLVILIINIGVLFMCRRNLKKLLKSTKENQRDEVIQDYFEAFNTLHNTKSSIRGTIAPNMIKTENILNIPQLQQQLRTNSSSSGTDDSLLHESAQLFYNPQFNREMTIRQSSAFKPFNRIDLNENNNANNNLIQIQNLLLSQQQQIQQRQNQYDKMSHQPVLKAKNLIVQNDSTGQYAHTYESLDTLEMPNRRTVVHLGLNSRNYRTILNNTNDSNLLQSPNSTDITDVGNFNLSTSTNLSSTSGNSSTHQFIKNNQQLDFNPNLIQFQQQQQVPLTQAQLVAFNNLMLNNQTGMLNLVNSSEKNCTDGEWSPDSAYYSSIPNNYSSFNMKQPFNNSQQFIVNNNNRNLDNFKTHLV